jgi:integration host factor subunit beta
LKLAGIRDLIKWIPDRSGTPPRVVARKFIWEGKSSIMAEKEREKITKAEIIENIYEESKINRKDIHFVIDAFFEEVKKALEADNIIELRGFGTFEIRTRKGRQKARNPKTGEIVSVQTHGVTVFRPGKELKKVSWELRH